MHSDVENVTQILKKTSHVHELPLVSTRQSKYQMLLDAISRWPLVVYLVKIDLKINYSNKIFGYLWGLIDPLVMMAIYTILVRYIFKRGDDIYPAALFTALLSWKWFSTSSSAAVNCIIRKVKLIQTVKFPLIALPLAATFSNMFRYFLGLLVLLPLIFLAHIPLTPYILLLPFVIFIQLLYTIAFSLFLSIVGSFFRDLENIIQFVLRVWFYASPALYSIERVPERYQWLMHLNPFALLFESYKNIIILGKPLPNGTFMHLLSASGLLAFGIFYFFNSQSKVIKAL